MSETTEIVVPEKITEFSIGVVDRANEFVVDSDESNERVTDFLARVKMAIRDIKKSTERVTKPLEKLKKEFLAEGKEHAAPFVEAKEILDKKQIDRARIVRDKKRDEQARLDDIEEKRLQDMEDKKKKLEAKGIKTNVPVIQEEAPAEEKKTIKTSGMYGTSSVRFIPRFRVIDFALLPDEHKIENKSSLAKAAIDGIKEIPGCEWYEDGSNTSRGA